MKSRPLATLLTAVLTLCSPAPAGTVWYVNGVSGSDNNNCLSVSTACKTIGHAISLASSGDSIRVAAATYKENLTIGTSVKILGAGAKTTILDGGGIDTVVTIFSATAQVILSGVTITNGASKGDGAGIFNSGALTLVASTLTGNKAGRSCFQILPSGESCSATGLYNVSLPLPHYRIPGCVHIVSGENEYRPDGEGRVHLGTVTRRPGISLGG